MFIKNISIDKEKMDSFLYVINNQIDSRYEDFCKRLREGSFLSKRINTKSDFIQFKISLTFFEFNYYEVLYIKERLDMILDSEIRAVVEACISRSEKLMEELKEAYNSGNLEEFLSTQTLFVPTLLGKTIRFESKNVELTDAGKEVMAICEKIDKKIEEMAENEVNEPGTGRK